VGLEGCERALAARPVADRVDGGVRRVDQERTRQAEPLDYLNREGRPREQPSGLGDAGSPLERRRGELDKPLVLHDLDRMPVPFDRAGLINGRRLRCGIERGLRKAIEPGWRDTKALRNGCWHQGQQSPVFEPLECTPPTLPTA